MEKLAWIKIRGVPCHAWGEKFFSLKAETKGFFVKYDEGTLLKTRMDEACICLLTKFMGRLEESLIVNINGTFFTIRFKEVEDPCITKLSSSRFMDGYASSISSQAEESGSDMEEHGEALMEEENEAVEEDSEGTGDCA